MPQHRIIASDMLGDGESIEGCIMKIRDLLAADTDDVVVRLRDRIEPDSLMQRRQSGDDAVPRECFERFVHRGMGYRRVRPFNSPVKPVRTRMRFIPQQSPEDEQSLGCNFHPGPLTLRDKLLNPHLLVHVLFPL